MSAKTDIYCDGSLRNGIIYLGGTISVYDHEGDIVFEDEQWAKINEEQPTSNRAELYAIIHMLTHFTIKGRTTIYSDSSYAVNVINLGKKIKKNLDLINKARSLLTLTGVSLIWIPRNQNTQADLLSKMN